MSNGKKKMNKDTRRLLIIAAVLIVIFIAYKTGIADSPAEPVAGGGDSGGLMTLPPVTETEQVRPAVEEPDPTAVPQVMEEEPVQPAEEPVPQPEEEPAYTEDYPEDIGYTDGETLDEYGTYSGAEDVAYYLHVYGHLPDNYITKAEAEDAGWVASKGNLWKVAYGACIGGDRFGYYEGLLPKGEKYYECDVNYEGGYRGEERLIFTDDGDVYYTNDHYKSFTKLY